MISKALPIEFYLNGQQVYNAKTSPFMDFKKFFQKVGCEEEVKIQFTSTEQHSYRLRFLDESDAEIDNTSFVVASYPGFYRYTATFTFQSLGICDQKVSMQIFYSNQEISGELTDIIETMSGTLSVNQTISGSLTDIIEVRSGPPQATHLLVFNVDDFRLADSSVCSAGLTTLYWNTGPDWGEGTQMYTDQACTIPATGFDLIVRESDGEIYNMDSGTGIVGTGTATFC